jgi:hypothetical protein
VQSKGWEAGVDGSVVAIKAQQRRQTMKPNDTLSEMLGIGEEASNIEGIRRVGRQADRRHPATRRD